MTTFGRHKDDMVTTLGRHGDDLPTTYRRCGLSGLPSPNDPSPDLPSPAEAGFAKAGGFGPQGGFARAGKRRVVNPFRRQMRLLLRVARGIGMFYTKPGCSGGGSALYFHDQAFFRSVSACLGGGAGIRSRPGRAGCAGRRRRRPRDGGRVGVAERHPVWLPLRDMTTCRYCWSA